MVQIEKNAADFIYLLSCALTERVADENIVAKMDLLEIERIAKSHGLVGVVAVGLEQFWKNSQMAQEHAAHWAQQRGSIMRRLMLMNAEREQILKEFERYGIWYLPLKGVVLQHLYPQFGMRQMSDNDILFDSDKRDCVKRIMEERGYHLKADEETCDDLYQKDEYFYFEMHYSLFEDVYPELCLYYDKLKNRLQLKENSQFHYLFSDEDFYIYLITHAYKHYQLAGTGLRTLTDCFVYTQKKAECLDWTYIESELVKLGMDRFEKQCRNLAERLFLIPKRSFNLTDDEINFLLFMMDAGTFGSDKTSIRNQVNAISVGKVNWTSKLRYVFSRLFPDMQYVEKNYPWFVKNRWAMPALWIFRLLRGIIVKPKKLIREICAVYQAKEKER